MPVTNSDNSRSTKDAAFVQVGAGMLIAFRCARCNQNRSMDGRKKQLVQGVKQYVCRGCAR